MAITVTTTMAPSTISARGSSEGRRAPYQRGILVATIVVGALGCHACSCSKSSDRAPSDGTADVGFDGAVDTVGDTRPSNDSKLDVNDSTPPDATSDAPYLGKWIPVPGAPPECGTPLAADPAISAPALKWIACPSGRAGCQRLVVDWTTQVGRVIGFRDDPVRSVGATVYIDFGRIWPDAADNPIYSVDALQPLDGPAVVAVRFTAFPTLDRCGFNLAIGDAGPALLGGTVGSGSAYQFDDFLAWSTWAAPNALSLAIVSHSALLAPTGGGVATAFSAQTIFVETDGPRAIVPFDTVTRKVTGGSTTAELPTAVHDGALAVYTGASTGLVLIGKDGTSTIVAHPETGRIVSQQAVDRANAEALIWIESDVAGVSYINPTIWTAPYTTSETSLVRRKVAKFTQEDPTGGAGMVVNRGVALNLTGTSTALITRLSDGMGWVMKAEPGDGFALPLWIDDDEVWLATADATLPSFKTETSGIVRIRRSTLGAPTVPPGT